MATGIDGPRIGNYMGVRDQFDREINGVRFTVFIYGAYNAFGLIGSECNGIGVVNQTAMCVVTDNVHRASSGWFGATLQQTTAFHQVRVLGDVDFLAWIEATEDFRGNHTLTA